MVPVAVSVPGDLAVDISMNFENWAFGDFVGKPRE